MAMFLAEIAFLLELALFAGGLVLWHQGREGSGGLLRGAAAILVVGSVLTALCTGYFSIRYHVQGEFDRAYPVHAVASASPMTAPGGPSDSGRGMGMGPGGMGPGMMGPGMMPGGSGTPGRPGGPPTTPDPGLQPQSPEHLEHHPDEGESS